MTHCSVCNAELPTPRDEWGRHDYPLCWTCHWDGKVPLDLLVDCDLCDGTGKERCNACEGRAECTCHCGDRHDCPACNSTGLSGVKCRECVGTGKVERNRDPGTLDVSRIVMLR